MKSEFEIKKKSKTIEVEEKVEIHILETIDDLSSPDFIKYIRKKTSKKGLFELDSYSNRYRLSKDLMTSLKSKVDFHDPTYIGIGSDVLKITKDEFCDEYSGMFSSSLYFSLISGVKTLNQFKDGNT